MRADRRSLTDESADTKYGRHFSETTSFRVRVPS
jgi:hypothetical protein